MLPLSVSENSFVEFFNGYRGGAEAAYFTFIIQIVERDWKSSGSCHAPIDLTKNLQISSTFLLSSRLLLTRVFLPSFLSFFLSPFSLPRNKPNSGWNVIDAFEVSLPLRPTSSGWNAVDAPNSLSHTVPLPPFPPSLFRRFLHSWKNQFLFSREN